MKTKKQLFSLLCVLLLLSGCTGNEYYHYNRKRDISDVLLLKTDESREDLCIVTTMENFHYATSIIPHKYLLLTEENRWDRFVHIGGHSIMDFYYQTYNLNLYSIETRELVKTYTLKEINKALPKGYRIFCNFGNANEVFQNNGQDYLVLSAVQHQKEVKKKYDQKYFTINIETDEMKLLEEVVCYEDLLENSEQAKKFKERFKIFSGWTIKPDSYQFLTANGFSPLFVTDEPEYLGEKRFYCRTGYITRGYRNEGIAEVRIMTDSLPKENKKLYNKFPELKEYQKQKGLMATIFLGGFPTAEEVFRLFLEEGAEISFEGCVMDGKYSKDGQPHEIGSFEEFNEWYQSNGS